MKNSIIILTFYFLLITHYCYGTQSKPSKIKNNKNNQTSRVIPSKNKKLLQKKYSVFSLNSSSYLFLLYKWINKECIYFSTHNEHDTCIRYLEQFREYNDIKNYIRCLDCENEDREIILSQPGNIYSIMNKYGLVKKINNS